MNSPTPDAAKVTPLTDEDIDAIAAALAESLFCAPMDTLTGAQYSDTVDAARSVIAALTPLLASREAKAAAKALRNAAENAEMSDGGPSLHVYLHALADELDPSDRRTT